MESLDRNQPQASLVAGVMVRMQDDWGSALHSPYSSANSSFWSRSVNRTVAWSARLRSWNIRQLLQVLMPCAR